MFRQDHEVVRRRIQRLQHDLDEMTRLCRACPAITFKAAGGQPSAPDSYVVTVHIRCVTSIGKHGVLRYQDHFHIEVELPPDYPAMRPPECVIYPAPFHPHVKKARLRKAGRWIDPRASANEGLGNLVLRIVRSLQYDPRYIDVTTPTLGNPSALEWYTSLKSAAPGAFPLDTGELPDSIPASKTFVIEPKMFEIDNTKPRTDSGTSTPTHPAEERYASTRLQPQTNERLSAPVRQVQTRKTWEVESTTPGYQPEFKPKPEFLDLLPSDFRGFDMTHELYIQPEAVEQIFEHIAWSELTSFNKFEQGGILLGRVFKDDETNIVWGVVEEAIPGKSAVGTSAYLEMDHKTWKQMIDRVDEMLEQQPEKQYQIVGWFHTHPLHLDVFMSSTDVGTQRRHFSRDWQFAVVLNPQKRIWRVFYGENAEECKGFMLGPKDE